MIAQLVLTTTCSNRKQIDICWFFMNDKVKQMWVMMIPHFKSDWSEQNYLCYDWLLNSEIITLQNSWFLWRHQYWPEGHQTLAQFQHHSDNWYSKCFEPKGCPKKNLKYVFWSRGQKSKFQTWSNCAEILHGLVGYQYKLFVFSGPYWFRPILKKYSHFKEKNGYILETKPEQKNCHCAKKF